MAPPPVPDSAVRRQSTARTAVLSVVVAGVAIVGAAAGVIVFTQQDSAQETPRPTTITRPRTTSAAPESATPESTVTSTRPTTVPVTATGAVAASTTAPSRTTASDVDLRRQMETDRSTADSLVGQWVPQLSSRVEGLVVNGVTYDNAAIMTDFRNLRGRYPRAILVNSSDYTNFTRKSVWVALESTPYGSPDDANAWCDRQGFAPVDCFASRLSHTGGPAGNVKHR